MTAFNTKLGGFLIGSLLGAIALYFIYNAIKIAPPESVSESIRSQDTAPPERVTEDITNDMLSVSESSQETPANQVMQALPETENSAEAEPVDLVDGQITESQPAPEQLPETQLSETQLTETQLPDTQLAQTQAEPIQEEATTSTCCEYFWGPFGNQFRAEKFASYIESLLDTTMHIGSDDNKYDIGFAYSSEDDKQAQRESIAEATGLTLINVDANSIELK